MKLGGDASRARTLILGILITCAVYLVPHVASAATLFLSPGSSTVASGGTLQVTLRIDSKGTVINAVEGTLSFDPALLRVQSLSNVGSIITLRVQDPSFSNSEGTINFNGVILNPGFNGASGNLLTITFQTIGTGTANVRWSSASILANDGQGTNVYEGSTGGVYTIAGTPAPKSTPASVKSATPSLTPMPTATDVPQVITPDPSVWYRSPTLTFQWILPANVDGVSYLINPKPAANPGNRSDGRISSASFSGIPDGMTYFHIKFHRKGGWGSIAHVAVRVDTQLPRSFAIRRVDVDAKNPRPQLSFTTSDDLSGVASYSMQIDGGDWAVVPDAPVQSPYALPPQSATTHMVVVRATDAAGNTREASILITVAPGAWLALWARFKELAWASIHYHLLPYIIGLIFICILSFILYRLLRQRRMQRAVRVLTRQLTKEDKVVAAQLRKLLADIDGEISVLAKLARHRGLYPEERFLRSKLTKYRTTIRSLVDDSAGRATRGK